MTGLLPSLDGLLDELLGDDGGLHRLPPVPSACPEHLRGRLLVVGLEDHLQARCWRRWVATRRAR